MNNWSVRTSASPTQSQDKVTLLGPGSRSGQEGTEGGRVWARDTHDS